MKSLLKLSYLSLSIFLNETCKDFESKDGKNEIRMFVVNKDDNFCSLTPVAPFFHQIGDKLTTVNSAVFLYGETGKRRLYDTSQLNP